MNTLKPIRTEADSQAALARIHAIFDSRPGDPAFDEFEVLAILIEAYEAEHHAIAEPNFI